jgi:hypothetical protein
MEAAFQLNVEGLPIKSQTTIELTKVHFRLWT